MYHLFLTIFFTYFCSVVLAESVSVEFDSSDLLSLIKNGNDTYSNLTASTRKAFSNESQIPAIDFGDGLLQDIGREFSAL